MVKEKEIAETNLSKAVIDLLIEIPMFDQIKSDDLKILARSMNFMDFQPREVIFSEGDKGDFVCFVTRGALDVVKKNEKGKDVVIATLGKGRSIGEMSIIDDFPRSATVKAKSQTTLLILTRKRFEDMLEQHPQIGVKLLKGIAKFMSMNMRKTSSLLADYMLPL
ncbi:MAG: cyclic nucleotide-binding domain-containing protein [Deltaproteobacteria bacterium]|nr:cyclic nucleotide-binding domain-containing protein [Deltaproteobacteria bacterium]